MMIGILSDSHGQVERVRRALMLFDRMGVDQIIHCGDVGGVAVFEEFVGRPFRFVWGNTDEPDQGLLTFLRTAGIRLPESIPLRLTIEGRELRIFHGHEREFQHLVPEDDTVSYVLHGHTHMRRDEREGRIRFINPGALQRARQYSVATLDVSKDQLEFHVVE